MNFDHGWLWYSLRPHHLGDISVGSGYLQKLHYIKNAFTLWEFFWPAWNFYILSHFVWIAMSVDKFNWNWRNREFFVPFRPCLIVVLYNPFLTFKTFHFIFLYNWFCTNLFGHIFLFIKKQWIESSMQWLHLMIEKKESIQHKSFILNKRICKSFLFLRDSTFFLQFAEKWRPKFIQCMKQFIFKRGVQ